MPSPASTADRRHDDRLTGLSPAREHGTVVTNVRVILTG